MLADGGYADSKLAGALRRTSKRIIDIIKPSYKTKGFEILPRR